MSAGIIFLGLATRANAATTGVSAADLSPLRWRNIGPAIAGGRVAAVAGTNADPLLYYFGAAGGGVWRTTNGGVTWNDVFGKQPVASIGAIAIAPSDKRVVWVGTGESKPRNDLALGDGVWKSIDGGNSWHQTGVSSPSIARILIDPHNLNVVLVGALGDPYKDSRNRGVFRTTDGGATWQQTLYVGPASGASDLAWDARGRKLVFAGIWQIRRVPWNFTSGGPDDGLYRSRDGGITWRRLVGHGLPGGIMGRIGVAVAPSDPRIVYALIQSKEGSLWRSADGGDTWKLITRDSYVNQRPFYMSRLEVDPRNPDHLFFLSEDLIESTDGGQTFHNTDNQTHQDHHAMWIAADGMRMIEGNDGGAPISVNGGKTWDWRYNVPIAQIYHVGYDMGLPYQVCGGMQDNDSYCGPSDSLSPLGILNHDWRDVGSDSDGSWVWPDSRDGNFVWNVGVRDLNGQLTIFDRRTRESYDITPYVRDTSSISLTGLPYRFNWEAPVAFSRLDAEVAYYGGNVVWSTRDRGRHWHQISSDLTLHEPAHLQVAGGPINTDASGAEFFDTILDIAVSPLDRNVIWVGNDDGLIHLTRDGGDHWQNVTIPGVKSYGRVEAIDASPHAAAAAFAAVDRHFSGDDAPYVFATSDYGATWKSISGDLPSDEIIHVIRQDPRSPDLLYAGGEHGVFVSLNRGAHWMPLMAGMSTVSVHDLRIHPRDNDLIAATHGRGFYILDDLAPLQNLAAAPAAAPALFQPRTAYTYFRWWAYEYGSGGPGGAECCPPANIFSGENPPAGVILSYYLSHPAAHAPSLTFTNNAGRVVAHASGSNAVGLNRTSWDLTEDAPVPWRSARAWNQGPSGLTVIPGVFTVRLDVDGQIISRSLTVRPDPRAQWTQAQYVERHAFLAPLYDDVTQIDTALNDLDAIRAALARTLQSGRARGEAAANAAEATRQLREAQMVESEFTSNPRNSEDNQWKPDKLRERLLTLIDTYAGLSQGPPLPAHRQEAAEIAPLFNRAMTDYRRFKQSLKGDV